MGILTDIRLLTELNRLMSENHRFSTSLNRQAAFITYFVVVLTESLSSMISSEGLDKIIRSVIIFLYCFGKKKTVYGLVSRDVKVLYEVNLNL